MAFVLADRVKETTTTTGTGTITLVGAATGFQSFSAIGNGNSTYYTIAGLTSGEWEVGVGTYTASGTTLSRDTVLASSNSGSLVNFSAGTKDVFCDYPAGKAIYTNPSGISAVTTATNVAGGAANQIVYQSGSSTTGFIDAPVSSNTALIWNGSAFAWGSAGATITDDTTTNTNYYPVWANASSGSLTTAYVSSSKMTFNPSTGTMTCTAFSGSGASLTSLNASNLSTGTVGTARLGSGTASSSTYLRGDGTWSTVSASPAGSTTQVQYNNAGAFAGSANLTFNGTNLTCGGTVTANSDESLKTNWRELPADFVEQLAKVKHGTYDRVDLELTQDGVSAQSLQKLLPNSVLKGEDGKLSVAYGNAALVAAIKLAERVVQLEAIVAKLTKE